VLTDDECILFSLLFFACGGDGWVHRAKELVAGTSGMNAGILVGMHVAELLLA
jgi:hypothetical protein